MTETENIWFVALREVGKHATRIEINQFETRIIKGCVTIGLGQTLSGAVIYCLAYIEAERDREREDKRRQNGGI